MTKSTAVREYTDRLIAIESTWWKRLLPVQAPYRFNLSRLNPGFMLDIGCGIGRNLRHIHGNGVGVDHNMNSVRLATDQGFRAFTSEGFQSSQHSKPETFDSVLFSHILEHVTEKDAVRLVGDHLKYLKMGGRLSLFARRSRLSHRPISRSIYAQSHAPEYSKSQWP